MLTYLLWHKHTTVVLLQHKLSESYDEIKQQHIQLEILAQRDALTGLFNRREFAKLASIEHVRAKRSPSDMGQVIPMTGSFGVTTLTKKQEASLKALYAAADAALYNAKANGRNRVEACDVVGPALPEPGKPTLVT